MGRAKVGWRGRALCPCTTGIHHSGLFWLSEDRERSRGKVGTGFQVSAQRQLAAPSAWLHPHPAPSVASLSLPCRGFLRHPSQEPPENSGSTPQDPSSWSQKCRWGVGLRWGCPLASGNFPLGCTAWFQVGGDGEASWWSREGRQLSSGCGDLSKPSLLLACSRSLGAVSGRLALLALSRCSVDVGFFPSPPVLMIDIC